MRRTECRYFDRLRMVSNAEPRSLRLILLESLTRNTVIPMCARENGPMVTVKDIAIDTEILGEEQRNVSTIDIVLVKK